MTQSNFNLPNTDGATFRSNNNTAHQAHATWSSGSTAPGTTYPYQVWIDTANGLLKRRNASNTAWITEGNLDGSNPLELVTSGLPDVGTLSDLQSISIGNLTTGDVRYMRGRTSDNDGGEGVFVWDGSDLSTEVGNDEVTASEGDGGIYVAPSSDKTGASGAWVRQMAPFRADFRQASWYGTDGQAILDAISSLGSEGGHVHVPAGTWSVTSTITLNKVELSGDSRTATVLTVDADVDGVAIERSATLRDLRVKGTGAMSTTATCLSLGEGGSDTARSALRNIIIGGSSTFIGDASTSKISGDGIRGDVVFLMEFSHIWVTNARNGYFVTADVPGATQGINYSLHFTDVEFHECIQGCQMSNMKAVTGLITSEQNDQYGAILGSAKGCDLTFYMEQNHKTTGAGLRADLWVDGAQVSAGDDGGGLSIRGNFQPGPNSQYGIYIDGQRGFDLDNLYFETGYANADIRITGDASNWGRIGSSVRTIAGITNDKPQQVVQANASDGFEANYLNSVVTGVAGSGGTVDLFTPENSDIYDLYVSRDGSSSRSICWLGIIFKDRGGVVVGDAVRAQGLSVGNNVGAVQLTNNSGVSADFTFIARRRGKLT